MEKLMIVDGYNVIYDWPELQEIMDDDLAYARDRLIDALRDYQGGNDCQIIIVFDAYLRKKATSSHHRYKGVEVVFTKENETADAYIEKITWQLKRGHEITVVTSDNAQQQMIIASGALRMPARELIQEIRKHKEETRGKSKLDNGSRLYEHLDADAQSRLEKIRKNQHK